MILLCISVLIGVAIGILVEKSNLLDPEIIIKQFLWQDFTLLKISLLAVATSMLVFSILNYLDIMIIESFRFNVPKVILGSLLLGFGIVLTGALPITIMAQLGIGYVDAIFVFLGVICGGMIYRGIDPILGYLDFIPKSKIMTVHEELGFDYWFVAPIFSLLLISIVVCFGLIERRKARKDTEEEEAE